MKKNEREQLIDSIYIINEHIRETKAELEGDLVCRNELGGKCLVKWDIKEIRRLRSLLCAAEKQIPMPVKIYVIPIGKCVWDDEEEAEYVVSKRCYCQNCGCLIPEYHFEERLNFCSHCGQKLWWPKN